MQSGIAAVAVCAVLCIGCVAENPRSAQAKNPCENAFCTKGYMCEPSADGHTTCVCPETCPELESPEPVCSSYGVEFSSACEMHKFACRLEIMMTVKSKGHCDEGEVSRCPLGKLLQFHKRYLMFLMIAKAREEGASLEYDSFKLDSLRDEEKRAIIEWEFMTRDLNKSGMLEPREVLLMAAPQEGCMPGFLRSCDFDGQPGISRREWATCFPPTIGVDTEDPSFA